MDNYRNDTSVRNWFAILENGTILSGKKEGSFANFRNRTDIVNMFVETKKGRVFAYDKADNKPLKIDFCGVVKATLACQQRPNMKPSVLQQRPTMQDFNYKFILLYKDKRVVKIVSPEGKITYSENALNKKIGG